MAEPALDDMLEQLYAADPSDFIALRKQLQGELRAAGLKPEAALLAKARRPTTAMWAVNQLVRRQPELVASLLERSEALRDAQTQALRGERDTMREAMRAHRAAVDAALEAALGILGARANDGFRDEIAMILRAASAQPEIGRELQLGRLVRTDDSTPGFPDLGDVEPAPLPAPAEPRREPAKKPAAAAPKPNADAAADAERARRASGAGSGGGEGGSGAPSAGGVGTCARRRGGGRRRGRGDRAAHRRAEHGPRRAHAATSRKHVPDSAPHATRPTGSDGT